MIALAISAAVAVGAVASTIDTDAVASVASGKWLTAPLEVAQQRNTDKITALESKVEALVKDIDFVAKHTVSSIRRSDNEGFDRFASLEAEIALLKDKLAGVEAASLMRPLTSEVPAMETTGLRSSLHDLSAAHQNAVAAITKRLDRIEVLVGQSTDLPTHASDRHRTRRAVAARPSRKRNATSASEQPFEIFPAAGRRQNQPFNAGPFQPSDPMRLSRLPG